MEKTKISSAERNITTWAEYSDRDLISELQQTLPQQGSALSKAARFGIAMAVLVGMTTWVTQEAKAFSALNAVNRISSSGGVSVQKDILYGDEPLQDLDLYFPKPLTDQLNHQSAITTTYPLVVFVHGGSWKNGSKDDYAFVGQSLAKAGYVTAVINYRKAPEHVYPDYVNDTAKAIAWSYHNAPSFFANPNKMAVMGHSAGAFNMMAAVSNADFLAPFGMKPSDIKAVIGIAGPYSYDFRRFGSSDAFPKDGDPNKIMPNHLIKGDQPEYLLLTAEKDTVVHDSNTLIMTEALKAHGAQVTTGEIKGASHATSIGAMATPLQWLNNVRAQVLDYLAATL